MRMLQPTELGALSAVDSGLINLKPKRRGISGNKIAFPGDIWGPEAVNHVRGVRLNHNRLPHWNVNLVRGYDRLIGLRIGIHHFPPPLVTYHGDGDWVFRSQPLHLLPRNYAECEDRKQCKYRNCHGRSHSPSGSLVRFWSLQHGKGIWRVSNIPAGSAGKHAHD